MSTTALLNERGTTHGKFTDNAKHGQTLREYFRETPGWRQATLVQREALDMMACKLSRILSGQPSHDDHWRDIAGYATLAITEQVGSYDDHQQMDIRTCTGCGGRWHMHTNRCAECRRQDQDVNRVEITGP